MDEKRQTGFISKLEKAIEERIEYLIREDDDGCADRCDELREVLFWVKENAPELLES